MTSINATNNATNAFWSRGEQLSCSPLFPFRPSQLSWWYRWSIAVHFALALVGVILIRDADAVIENRMLELKAQTARQDIITTRKAAALGNALVLVSAKLRGFFHAWGLAWSFLWKKGTPAADILKQLDLGKRAI